MKKAQFLMLSLKQSGETIAMELDSVSDLLQFLVYLNL